MSKPLTLQQWQQDSQSKRVSVRGLLASKLLLEVSDDLSSSIVALLAMNGDQHCVLRIPVS